MAVRTARVALEVLGDVDASEAARRIGSEELGWALKLLRHTPAKRADKEVSR
jgi:hypothetical protein